MTSTSPQPLRLALVGTGEVARKNYAPFLASQPDVALAYHNRTPEKARALASEFGGEVFGTLEELIAWKPTAVFVLTSEKCRHTFGTALIERGAPRIFFDKPLVAARGQARVEEDDFTAARDMLRLAAQRGCETAMIFNYRFFAQTIAARELVASRKLGRVINIAAQVHFACWSHCIDLIGCFAGAIREITALTGATVRTTPVAEGCDVSAAFLTTDGAVGTIVGTAGMTWQHPLYELTFTFENGRVHLRDLDGTLELLDGARPHHETISFTRDTSRWANYDESFRKSIGAYLDSLRAGKPPPIAGEAGLRELQFEAALKRSIRERRPVRLEDEFPL
jgi:predicted dehydrogenase